MPKKDRSYKIGICFTTGMLKQIDAAEIVNSFYYTKINNRISTWKNAPVVWPLGLQPVF